MSRSDDDLRDPSYHSATYFVDPNDAVEQILADYEDQAEKLGEAVLIHATISLKEFKIKINELTKRTNHMLAAVRAGATRRTDIAPRRRDVEKIAPPPAPVRRPNGEAV